MTKFTTAGLNGPNGRIARLLALAHGRAVTNGMLDYATSERPGAMDPSPHRPTSTKNRIAVNAALMDLKANGYAYNDWPEGETSWERNSIAPWHATEKLLAHHAVEAEAAPPASWRERLAAAHMRLAGVIADAQEVRSEIGELLKEQPDAETD